jgi:hypothetical protein
MERLTDMDEGTPGIFIRGDFNHIAYTSAAPLEFTRHLYQWDLRCYYLGFRGCQVRDLAPPLWQSMQEMKERTARRKKEGIGCSDRILAVQASQFGGDVELLEVVKSSDATRSGTTAYKLREVLEGQSWEEKQARYRAKTPRPAPLRNSNRATASSSSMDRRSNPVTSLRQHHRQSKRSAMRFQPGPRHAYKRIFAAWKSPVCRPTLFKIRSGGSAENVDQRTDHIPESHSAKAAQKQGVKGTEINPSRDEGIEGYSH